MEEFLLQKLEQYGKSDYYPLHMPGHKRNIAYFEHPYAIDITEIDGFDNLFHAEEVLQQSQQRAAALYGAEESYYLVNGSTCGILSAVSASVTRGGRLVMARNSHKASYHAAFLNGARVSYLYPQTDWNRMIHGTIRPQAVEAALLQHPDTQVVLITSPTYDGVVSDVRKIAEIVHRFGAVLIVDEAHGAHFAMHPEFPESAVACGADLVINSLHKTLPSLTQTAVLHVQGERVDRKKLRSYLGIYQTSSPSYVLMAGMDACICQMQQCGRELYNEFLERLSHLRESLAQMKKLYLVDGTEPELESYAFDCSKVLITTERAGIDGSQLAQILREKYHLEVEMAAERYVTAIMTVGDTEEGFRRLETALLEIDAKLENESVNTKRQRTETTGQMESCFENLYEAHEEVLSIEEAVNGQSESVLLMESGGRVSAEYVYLYPPGIPLLVPGERIPDGLPQRLAYYREIGLHVQGLEDYSGEQIRVMAD